MERIGYSSAEVAELLSIDEDGDAVPVWWVRNRVAEGQLPFLRITCRCIRIPASVVDHLHGSPIDELDGLGTLFQMFRDRTWIRVDEIAESLGLSSETVLRHGPKTHRGEGQGRPRMISRVSLQAWLMQCRIRSEGELRLMQELRRG